MAAAYNGGKGLVMALGAEFSKRPDGLPGIEKAYGFKTTRDDIAAMQDALTYAALKDDKVDIAEVFTTDGRIKAFNFRVLTDDKEFFPNYAIVPVVRTETLKANPTGGDPQRLSAKITDEAMQRLNAAVDVDKKSIEDVATAFLKEKGLLKSFALGCCRRRFSRAGNVSLTLTLTSVSKPLRYFAILGDALGHSDLACRSRSVSRRMAGIASAALLLSGMIGLAAHRRRCRSLPSVTAAMPPARSSSGPPSAGSTS